eukprot:gene49793-608_t
MPGGVIVFRLHGGYPSRYNSSLSICTACIGADWYVGSAHHFLYTAPGVGFLVAPSHKQRYITMPLTVSYFDGLGFGKEFQYYGLQCF